MRFSEFMRAHYPDQDKAHLSDAGNLTWLEWHDTDEKGSIFIKAADAMHGATGIELFHFGKKYVRILLEWTAQSWRAFAPGQWTAEQIRFGKAQKLRSHMWYWPEQRWRDWHGENLVRPADGNDSVLPITDLEGNVHELDVVILESLWGDVKERYWYARDREDHAIVWGLIRWDWMEKDESGQWQLKGGGAQIDHMKPGIAVIPESVWRAHAPDVPRRTSRDDD